MPPSTLCGPALCTGSSRSERSGFKRHCIQLASRGERTSLNWRSAPIGSTESTGKFATGRTSHVCVLVCVYRLKELLAPLNHDHPDPLLLPIGSCPQLKALQGLDW